MAVLEIGIGAAEIQNAIAVAIAEAFSPERNAQIIRDVVRAHLSAKEGLYDKETILGKTVGNMIRGIAVDEVQKLISSQEDKIRLIVRDTLGPSFTDSIFDQLKLSLSRKVVAEIEIKATLFRD